MSPSAWVEALIQRADALAPQDPDRARELLVLAAEIAMDAGVDGDYHRACEVFARLAQGTGHPELAEEALKQIDEVTS